ncbi:UDP-glucosyltransferase 2-like [Phlebotomus argentipes]|uniref:UDP-glucosyltransferase 2-like n=1 Tax=Phlebotomus argentipes TaxID=94469 RepID=UPI002892AF1A|nr:UDP-glucosyltransferase 2-like [Phlebotomus argentipes]
MKCFAIILLYILYLAHGANILVLDTEHSRSNHIWIRTITAALAEKGHNVTSLSTYIEEETPKNFHYLHLDKVYDVFYNPEDEDFVLKPDFFLCGEINSYLQIILSFLPIEFVLKGCLKSKGFRQLLAYPNDFKFDLVLHDYSALGVMLPFVKKFSDPPVIALISTFSVEVTAPVFGGTIHSSYVPRILNDIDDLTTFYGRFNSFVKAHLDYFWRKYFSEPRLNNMLKKKFNWDVNVRELSKLSKIALVNKYPGLDIIEEALPNVISVGGLQIQRNKNLTKDFQEIMDNAKNGVILFSLGTNVKSATLGVDRQIEILEAFRQLPEYTFIWKFEADSLPVDVSPNVIVKKWVPQCDLLAHPNLKLFISHCGLLSTQEAVWYGVPILGLPIFFDQFINSEVSVKTGFAERGDIRNIERKSFKKLIEKMMSNSKYRENAKILSEIFRDQMETPLERAIWWIEYVLRHPNMTHMETPSRNLNLAQRESWDVLALLYTLILVSALMSVKLCCFICQRCTRKIRKTYIGKHWNLRI